MREEVRSDLRRGWRWFVMLVALCTAVFGGWRLATGEWPPVSQDTGGPSSFVTAAVSMDGPRWLAIFVIPAGLVLNVLAARHANRADANELNGQPWRVAMTFTTLTAPPLTTVLLTIPYGVVPGAIMGPLTAFLVPTLIATTWFICQPFRKSNWQRLIAWLNDESYEESKPAPQEETTHGATAPTNAR